MKTLYQIVLPIALVLLANVGMAQNLFVNPSFEDDGGWKLTYTWVYEYSSEDVHSGTRSIKGVDDGDTWVSWFEYDQTIGVVSGTQYEISVWIKAATPFSGSPDILFRNADLSINEFPLLNMNVTQEWQQFSAVWTAPQTTDITIYFHTDGNLNGTFYWDDAYFGPPTTPVMDWVSY